MTPEEFLTGYAQRSGVTPESLINQGRVVAECHCDYESCEGWQLAKPEILWRGERIAIPEHNHQPENSLRKVAPMQAKDIPDAPIIAFLATFEGLATTFPNMPGTVQQAMPEGVPEKLARAKMKSLIKRGLVGGCACGCRGEYTLI